MCDGKISPVLVTVSCVAAVFSSVVAKISSVLVQLSSGGGNNMCNGVNVYNSLHRFLHHDNMVIVSNLL